jgi:hypothetical protein
VPGRHLMVPPATVLDRVVAAGGLEDGVATIVFLMDDLLAALRRMRVLRELVERPVKDRPPYELSRVANPGAGVEVAKPVAIVALGVPVKARRSEVKSGPWILSGSKAP